MWLFLSCLFIVYASEFIGKEWALEKITSSLNSPASPRVMLLLGPPGTGKTLVAKQFIASKLFPGFTFDELVRQKKVGFFGMSIIKSETDLNSFLSPPSGVIGEGSLVDIYRKTENPLIIFDEIEKGHPTLIADLLLTMLDDTDGFIQDKKTHAIYSTKKSTIVLTTNCFTSQVYDLLSHENPETISRLLEQSMLLVSSPRCQFLQREDVYRRLVAGHKSTSTGFILFLPPTLQDAITLVNQLTSCENITAQVKDRFFSPRTYLEKAREQLGYTNYYPVPGGLSAIQSYVLYLAKQNCQVVYTPPVLKASPPVEFADQSDELQFEYYTEWAMYYFQIALAFALVIWLNGIQPILTLGVAVASQGVNTSISMFQWGVSILVIAVLNVYYTVTRRM